MISLAPWPCRGSGNEPFSSRRVAGFTLIEVAVALSILGWVMGGALYLIQQYSDERIRLREQFYSARSPGTS